MDIKLNWKSIKDHFDASFRKNLHVVFASVDKDNNPIATPIGSLFLNSNQTGFYFEKFVSKIPQNIEHNNQVCILAINNRKLFWIKALFQGYFNSYPGLKLYGQLGERRLATDKELKRMQRRVQSTKVLKGNKYLWGDMKHIREIKFIKVEKINLGKMTQAL